MTTCSPETSTEELALGTPAGESKSWNWHPDILLEQKIVTEGGDEVTVDIPMTVDFLWPKTRA